MRSFRSSRFWLATMFLRYSDASMWRAVLSDPNKARRRRACQIFSLGPFLSNKRMLSA